MFFALGLFLSNFVVNTLVMMKPFVGEPVPFCDYFTKGNFRLHLVGIIGGMIWGVGMSFAIHRWRRRRLRNFLRIGTGSHDGRRADGEYSSGKSSRTRGRAPIACSL